MSRLARAASELAGDAGEFAGSTSEPANGAGSTPAVLSVRGLDVLLPDGADRAKAVDGLDLDVRAGEILCLVGESGSGKSLTGSAIMRLLPEPRVRVGAGSIRLDGEDLLAASEKRVRALRGERMAMIFQEPMTALNPQKSVGWQIDEVLRLHTRLGRGERRERTLGILERVRIPEPASAIDAHPHRLSGGQRQRVMIAMALVLEPRLIIADEPTTALDVTTQRRILDLIGDVQREFGTAVLFITHDFGVVAEIADRVAVMRHGVLVEEGDARAVLDAPRHAYTRSLIAAVPSLTPPVRVAVAGAGPTASSTISPDVSPDVSPNAGSEANPDGGSGTSPESRAGEIVLAARGLCKRFVTRGLLPGRVRRRVTALDEVSFDLHAGETLGVVGESGSGKTTLSRCVTRLLAADAGRVELDGQDLLAADARELRRLRGEIQMIFQDPTASLNPRKRVIDLIAQGPRIHGVSKGEARTKALELLALVELEPSAADRFPHEFSGGQRQRIGIARALALEPRVIVADEPVSALDVSVQAQILALLAELRERLNLSLLFVTHDLRVAAQLCDRVAVMQRGAIVEIGSTEAVFARPRHDYTRRLMASIPGRDWTPPALDHPIREAS